MIPRPRQAGCLASIILAGLSCLALFALTALGLWQRMEQYPNVLRRGHLSGMRWTVTGLGRCVTIDQHFYSGDQPSQVRDWYARHGWTEFVPFVYQQKIGPLGLGRFYTIDGGSRETMILTRQVYCFAFN